VNGLLLILTWLAPLLAALLALAHAGRWPVWPATLPALITALTVPIGAQWEVPWLLLGAQFGLDPGGQVFLLFTALLWLFAGLQADLKTRHAPHWDRFRVFFLLAMAGNFWLIVGQDLVNFFLGFALMGLAAYGLVIHHGDPASLRAGRVYLAMTLAAEVALFAAFLLVFHHTETLAPDSAQLMGLSNWGIGLLVFGLGIKAGLVLLHVWLPLAHPAAPVPASAVLSGTMIKAALIGWMRFLPLAQEPLVDWGNLLLVLGTVTVLYAIPIGLLQTNPKVVLAYSSVAKMGLMTAILGLALLAPTLTPAIVTALIYYAAHHGLAKGALFLGIGVARGTNAMWMLPALAIPALALAGAPFTSGASAKALLKPLLTDMQGLWADAMPLLLVTSTIGTTLLMARFLTLMGTERGSRSNATPWVATPWLVLVGVILGMPFLTGLPFPSVSASWPLLAGALLALLAALWGAKWGTRLVGTVPAGDILEPVLRLTRRWRLWLDDCRSRGLESSTNAVERLLRRPPRHRLSWTVCSEQTLGSWPVAGAVVLGIGGSLFLLLWMLP